MLPRLAFENRMDHRGADAVASGQPEDLFALRVQTTNLAHGVFGQLRGGVVDSNVVERRALAHALRTTPFAEHVCDVLFLGANKEVIRIDASPNVATMKDQQSFWDWANEVLVCEAMGAVASAAAVPKRAVATREKEALPEPTAIRAGLLGDLLQKTIDGVSGFGTEACYPGQVNLLERLAVPRLLAQRGAFATPNYTGNPVETEDLAMVRQDEEDRALAFRASLRRRALARQALNRTLTGNVAAAQQIRDDWEPVRLARLEAMSDTRTGDDDE